MNNSTRHTSELALIRAIPDLTLGTMKPCRTKGLFVSLQKAVDKDLSKLPKVTRADLEEIEAIMDEFGDSTGWFRSTKHIGTLLSFCASMIESSEFDFNPRILETINDLIDHLENGNDFHFQSCWAGSIASEKWEKLFEGETA